MRPDSEDDDEVTPRPPTDSEQRLHRRTYPHGVPSIRVPEDEPDDPGFDWPDPDRLDAEVLRRAGRDPGRAVSPAEVSAIVRKLAGRLREELNRLAPQDMVAALDDRLERFEARLRRQERDLEPVRKLGKWIAGIAFAAVIFVLGFVYHRGQTEQLVTDEIQRLKDDVRRLERLHEPQPGPRP